MIGRIALTGAGAVVAACAAGPVAPLPAIKDCVQGLSFADCGGDGAPRLACSDTDCLWFTTGRVAQGYRASDCPAGNVCCHAGWPFGTEDGQDLDHVLRTHEMLYASGLAPWDRRRAMDVTVTLDLELPHGDGLFHCDGASPLAGSGPCGGARAAAVPEKDADLVALRLADSGGGWLYGWNLVAEIDPITLRARVCTRSYTDSHSNSCGDVKEPLCASSGSLTLTRTRVTGETAGRLDVQLGTLHVVAGF